MSSPPIENLVYSQNFLRDQRLVRYLLDASSIVPADLVYEIGPGKGAITAALAGRCGRVIAVEKDLRLAEGLRHRLAAVANVEILGADFLDVPLPDEPYKLFANVPFNITAAIITKLASAPRPPEDCYLVVQRDAAERFLGRPTGTLYAALLHPCLQASVLYRFARSDFSPAPGVDVVMLRLCKRGPPLVPPARQQDYRDFVTYCFTSRHRTLRGTLGALLDGRRASQLLSPLGIESDLPPSAVPMEHWPALWSGFHLLAGAGAQREVTGAERRLRRQQAGLKKLHRTRAAKNRYMDVSRSLDVAL
jgi:23S rRNA (adenine-N6)-dimethyltransferase